MRPADGVPGVSVIVPVHDGAVTLHARDSSGPAAARNLGAERVSGNLVVFIDSDVCVRADTIERLERRFEADSRLDALIGSYDDAPASAGFISQYKNLLHHFVHQQGHQEATTFWTGCGAIRCEVFAAAGGFDESFERPCIEDIELGYGLRQQGRRIVLDPSIQVKHLKHYRLRSLLRSDIFGRALPWTRLILATGRLPNDLNLALAQRVSAALVVAATALGLAYAAAGFPLARQTGWGFAAAAAPLQWAYYMYSTLAFVAGAALHAMNWRGRRRRRLKGGYAGLPHTPGCG